MNPSYLPPDAVHSWCVPLDAPDACGDLYSILAPDERNRCARFRSDRDRRRFIVAHGALRTLIGRYLGTAAAELGFVYNAFGKPALRAELGRGLKFNLSHSADLALIAIAHVDVGIDVEQIRPQPDFDAIGRSFFSVAEVEDLLTRPSQLRDAAFFRYWTEKEAYVKACGEGLAYAPADRAGRWSVYTLQPAVGYVGALAVAGSGWRLTQCRWLCTPLGGGVETIMEHPPEKKPGPIEIPEPPNPREPAPWKPEREPRVPERPADEASCLLVP